jgi:uncharacterized protein YndB with AHSA1/START domain
MSNITARARMLIRAPVREVFDGFADPRRICEFWLKSSTGPLTRDAHVEWEFMVPGARETVDVLGFSTDERIKFRWSNGFVVDMTFGRHASDAARVDIVVSGFRGTDQIADAVTATEGFAIVLCDLKTLLETGRTGNMVRDKALLIADDMALR